MELEVGMYCFNKTNRKLGIGEIISFQSNNNVNVKYKNDIELVSIGNVIASHNIIDLIEEKDLLEIEYFSLRYEKRVTRLFEVTYKEGRFINLDNAKCQFMLIDNDWTDNDKELEPIIKSIVTKEQFESMAYKVGD